MDAINPSQIGADLKAAQDGDSTALGRLLSVLGRPGDARAALLGSLVPWSGGAHCVAFLGAAGAGKSTLMVEVARILADGHRRVGFVAGELVGEATHLSENSRYEPLSQLPSLFLHGVSRGGGASLEAALAADLFAHLGCDPVLIELGSGRRGFPQLQWGHSLVLVLSPGGPEPGVLAASGILGAADLVIVNKADREGGQELRDGLREQLERLEQPAQLLQSVAYRGEGIQELADAMLALGERLRAGDQWERRQQAAARLRVQELVAEVLHDRLERDPALGALLESAASELREGRIDLRAAADKALSELLKRP